ncbi:MAG: insulinase family protein [Muribaculaceae bacterium]|nr:insulinase family protein [Muribaculaceae bacterium]
MDFDPVVDRTQPPKTEPFGHLEIVPQQVETLSNGVGIHFVECGTQPVNRIVILWRLGKCDVKNPFATKLLPQLMLEGCEKFNGEEIADAVDFEGAWLNPRGEDYFTGFELISLNAKTQTLLELLSAIIKTPTFPESSFEAIKSKESARLRLNEVRTPIRASRRLAQAMSGSDHPYQNKNTTEVLDKLTREDIIDAWRFMNQYSHTDIFIGGLPDDNVKDSLREFALNLRDKPVPETEDLYMPFSPDKPDYIKLEIDGAKQASVAIGIPTINRSHPDYIPLRMTVTALGGYFGSRLMTNLREEKGLTYGISASLFGIRKDAYISIAADCDSKYVDEVIRNIGEEITKLATEPMDETELTRLKMYLGTMLASTLDSPFAVTDNYIIQLTLEVPDDYFEQQQIALKTLTAETIMKMTAKYLLPLSRSTTVVALPS